MFNKIDKKLIDRISVLSKNKKIELIVLSKDYEDTHKYLRELTNEKEVVYLPIIKGFCVSTSIKNIFDIASINSVIYISSISKVCSLVYKSKKIIKSENLKTNKISKHSCVVIDTGIYPHVDFCLGKNRIIKFVDLINKKEYPYDDNGHGTFVSGVLCANSITSKYSGIDNTCNIIVIKALNSEGETSSVIILSAMQWILDNKDKFNIKVVCMSFGSQVSNINDPLMYGAEVLWDNGIVVVSACGNSGPESSTIMSPGASRKIITVGSVKEEDGSFKVADFSSRGPAFGYYKPDLVLPGVDIISTAVFDKEKNFYTMMTGTSVSAPMVAGVVSLLFSVNPTYTPNQIKYMLVNSCDELTGDRNQEGFGLLNLDKIKLL